MEANSPWQLSPGIARLALHTCSAELSLSHPAAGLKVTLAHRSSLHVLGVTSEDEGTPTDREPLDAYTRGSDLIVAYPKTAHGVRTQIYWHAEASESTAPAHPEIDLWVSAQTDLLDSQPNLHVQSLVTASEVLECLGTDPADYRRLPRQDKLALTPPNSRRVQGLIFRMSDGWTYAQLLHPSDVLIHEEPGANHAAAQTTLVVESLGKELQYTCRSRLFFESLEKGVIRRARIRGVFVPREHDLEAVAASARRLIAQKLPLTT